MILMKSSEFIKDFCGKYDHTKFNVILVSNDIKTKGKHSNIYKATSLLPPTNAVSSYLNGNDKKSYYNKYFKHLACAQNDGIITTLVKLVTVDNTDVILLCTDDEAELKYFKPLKIYLEKVYNIKVFKFKDYKKNPNKCESDINPQKTRKVLNYKYKIMKEHNVGVPLIRSSVLPVLNRMKRKAVYNMARSYGVHIKSDWSKEKMIKVMDKTLWGGK